jgi:(R)-2-hydroxyacyl-CoA dehydratese activating ATPase
VIFAGIDIGSSTAKAVILRKGRIVSTAMMPVTMSVAGVADDVMADALKRAGLVLDDLDHVVSTGYGRNAVSFSSSTLSEIICHAKGVHYWIPQARTIIDIGGQDSKIIWINDRGNVANFVMNDKCAAGSGRFLELIAQSLGSSIDQMGAICQNSQNPCEISSTCAVFAESEVVSLRAEGKPIPDLVAGLHRAIAKRVTLMGVGRGFDKEIVFTGGLARNFGVQRALEEITSAQVLIPEDPVMTGALGAALEARAVGEPTAS